MNKTAPKSQEGNHHKKATRKSLASSSPNSFAFTDADLKTMAKHLPHAFPTVQGLFWHGANTNGPLADIAMLGWPEAQNVREGIVRGHRRKSGKAFSYCLWPELLQWYKERARAKADYYVFPELVFSERERRNPAFNNLEVPATGKAARIFATRMRALKVFNAFLVEAGFKHPLISFKSLRYHNFGLCVRHGVPGPLAMAACGTGPKNNYTAVSDTQIRRLNELTRAAWLTAMQ